MHEAARERAALPSGTVTFLFTDIEGSTVLWHRHAAAMESALSQHDALLRDAIDSSHGHVVKSTGDGFCAVFDAPGNALSACLAAQRALQAQWPTHSAIGETVTLKVRMGVHTGPAQLRDGDYFGMTLNRTARIMSAAHGAQVLLSAVTAELVRDCLPTGATLRNLGDHRLKGLVDPEHIFQLVAPDLRQEFPPLTSIEVHRLPAERASFIGRTEALEQLAQYIAAGARLISVLGIGGVGKTRFATRFGWRSAGEFPGGVWFCDLAQARSLDGIVDGVAQGLDLVLGKDDPVAQIGHALAHRGKCLVIVDNFEQVARHAEETLGRWLERASDVRFIVTTREVLGLADERVLALPPLGPADAATLMIDRAEAALPSFRPDADDRTAIAALVKLLDGLPLAIELAAARVRVMRPGTLLARMSERFKLLGSTSGRADRQATLRAVFDWSWGLLSPPEKNALAQLSVFEGGFTLVAVEAVVDLSACEDSPWTVDALQSLVQKSLVRQLSDARFDLLVSVQEYAAEQLRTAGRYAGSGPGALAEAHVRHGEYFARIGEAGAIASGGVELENVIAACRRAVARQDAAVATRTLEHAWACLKMRGPFRVAIELADAVAAMPALGATESARVEWIAGSAFDYCGNHVQACIRFEASLAQARSAQDRAGESRALITLGFRDVHAGNTTTARARLDAAVALAESLDDWALRSDAHNGIGVLEEFTGRVEEARRSYATALALAERHSDDRRAVRVLANLGGLCADAGSIEEARSHLVAALERARRLGDRRLESITLGNLGWCTRLQGSLEESLAHLESALEMARDMGLAHFECFLLVNLGIALIRMQRLEQARKQFAAALSVARQLGDRRSEGQALGYLALADATAGEMAQARERIDAGEALLRTAGDDAALVLLLCSRAEVENLAQAPAAARAALDAAAVIAAQSAVGAQAELALELARVRVLLDGG